MLHFVARIAIHFYCRDVQVNNPELLKSDSPILLASNHPNTFLDGIILCTLFDRPVYSLARGDTFVNEPVKKIFHALHLLPIYRKSEGEEGLRKDINIFQRVVHLLSKNKIVLIFSESHSNNEWHLRPLKKGTAKIAFEAAKQNIPLKVLPVGINYSNFKHLPKSAIINFGNYIPIESTTLSEGKYVLNFNERLNMELSRLVYEISPEDIEERKRLFNENETKRRNIFQRFLAFIGYILHFPLYHFIRFLIPKKAGDFYDGILIAGLILLYPLYILLFFLLCLNFLSFYYSIIPLLIMPISARSLVRNKKVVY